MTGNYYLLGLALTMVLLACMPVWALQEHAICIFGNANEDLYLRPK